MCWSNAHLIFWNQERALAPTEIDVQYILKPVYLLGET